MASTAYDIIKRPIITEQSMEATELKKYVFLVAESANKTEIKKAVSEIFGVKVQKVNTVSMKGRKRRMGHGRGRRGCRRGPCLVPRCGPPHGVQGDVPRRGRL